MTPQIALTLIILAAAIALFVSEKLRPDLIALMVLLVVVITGLVTPEQALSSFSNPAVIVVWSMFILSAALARTGVASSIGKQVMRFTGEGETRLIGVVMLATGLISGFTGMNNIGVTALMLPIVIDIARRTRRSASLLLLPMLYAVLLGGMALLISTSVNLLVDQALVESGYRSLGIFGFTPATALFLGAGILYMMFLGRRLLPERQTPRPLSATNGVPSQAALSEDHLSLYSLEERMALLTIPEHNPLVGKTLSESRIGHALGLNVLYIQRMDGRRLPPEPLTLLESGDRLLVLGRLDRIHELLAQPLFNVVEDPVSVTRILSAQVGLAEFDIIAGSIFAYKSLVELAMRQTYGVNVLAIQHDSTTRRTNLQNVILEPGDTLMVQGPIGRLEALRSQPQFRRLSKRDARAYNLDERLLYIQIPKGSKLSGETLEDARLGAAYGLVVLDLMRSGEDWLMPDADLSLEDEDLLIVEGRPQDIEVMRGLQLLKIEGHVEFDLHELETEAYALVEVVLSPYSHYAAKTLRELHFREKYGLSVLAIWRGERAYRTGLGEMPIYAGDAMLCYGPQDRFAILAREADFIVLKTEVQQKPRSERALVAVLVLVSVIALTILNLLPITIAAILGVVLMVLAGCLTMDEAYRSIEWKAVFLIAGMLPLGIAMGTTGTARFLADAMLALIGGYGPTVILAGLFILTFLATQFLPNPVVAVLMAPIAIITAQGLGIQPQAFVLGVAYAASCGFLTPIAHPANVLVLSPGGYRFNDYLKNGLPLAVLVLVITLLVVPLLWPY